MSRARKKEQAVESFDKLMITAEEAALVFSLRAETLRQWRRRGLLEATRVRGFGLLFRLTDIEHLYESRYHLFKVATGR
ncbi:MAG: hypothetical protein V7641_2886 [Blastocatellia bacterium]